VGPWAFQGAKPGETSELFDAEDGYYLARLDSLTPGGTLSLDQAKQDIRTYLLRQKKIDALLPRRETSPVTAASSLEGASKLMNMRVVSTKPLLRVTGVPELAGARGGWSSLHIAAAHGERADSFDWRSGRRARRQPHARQSHRLRDLKRRCALRRYSS
jgi:hypothetical protein